MARFHTHVQSTTAVAADAAVLFLMCPAGSGYALRRITGGLVTVASASAPPDQNCTLGITPATAGPTGAATFNGVPGTAGAVGKENPNSAAAAMIPATSYATTNPTFGVGAVDPVQIPCSSRGGFDLYWEYPENWEVTLGVANGLVFVNRVNALTTPLAWDFTVTWEE